MSQRSFRVESGAHWSCLPNAQVGYRSSAQHAVYVDNLEQILHIPLRAGVEHISTERIAVMMEEQFGVETTGIEKRENRSTLEYW